MTLTELDAILARHFEHKVKGIAGGFCALAACLDDWPCQTYRLAEQAKEAVVLRSVESATRLLTDEMLRADDDRIFTDLFQAVRNRLADYERAALTRSAQEGP